jgi:uncharacterized protein (TIGR00725 family)
LTCHGNYIFLGNLNRGVAQSGSALGSGLRSRWFKSSRPDLKREVFILGIGQDAKPGKLRDRKMTKKRQPIIAVIGAGKCSQKMKDLAEKVGKTIAENGAILVCGGLGGVMEAAAKGAKSKKGITLGILPGDSRSEANEYIDYAIPTGIGEARNLVVIKMADAVVALPGKFGTLSEMAFCMKLEKPLVSLSAWNISEKIEKFEDPVKAALKAIELAGK